MKNKLMLLVVLIVGIFSFKTEVNAAELHGVGSQSGVWGDLGTVVKIFDGDRSAQIDTMKFHIDSDTPAFCLEIGATFTLGTVSGTNLKTYLSNAGVSNSDTVAKTINDYLYFGYGYSGRTSNKYYLATQKLVWEELSKAGFFNTSYFKSNSFPVTPPSFTTIGFYGTDAGTIDLSSEVSAIKNSATNYYKKPSICSTSSLTLATGESKTLTDSNGVLSEYTVSCGSGLTCQATGNDLKVTANSVGDKTITLTKAKKGTEAMAYAHGNQQDLVAGGGVGPVSCSINLNLTNSVSISKQDATTSKELAGAHLVLKDSTGKVVDEWTSTTTPHEVANLAAGTYTLTETIAPSGYLKTTTAVTFVVKADGTVDGKVVMKNQPNGVPISKQDATTGKELAGAHLVLKNSSGKVIDEWTSTTTPHVVSKLAPGTYTLTETIAPKGYIKSTETVTFTVKSDGTVASKVVMKNQPEIVNPPTGTAAIIIAWVVGLAAVGYSIYYFIGLRKNKAK